MIPLAPIIKVTSACNLACTYCYDLPRMQASSNTVIADEVLDRAISQTLTLASEKARFIWHGGEPLVAGIDLFQRIVDLQNKYKKKEQEIQNDIQINGSLLNEAWIDFFDKNNFCPGLSLDGPPALHNKCRLTRRGEGTWQRVMDAIEMLRKRELDFGLLAVVSRANVDYPEEIYRFFVKSNLTHFDFLPHITKPYDLAVSPKEYATFMAKVFDLWMADDDPSISIRYLEQAVIGILGGVDIKGRMCSFAGTCADFITINSNGEVGPCDNLFPLADIRFGNILQDDLVTILSSPRRQDFAEKVADLPTACLECEYKPLCNGGCTRNRYLVNPDLSDLSYMCESRKLIFEHIQGKVDQIIDSIELTGGAL